MGGTRSAFMCAPLSLGSTEEASDNPILHAPSLPTSHFVSFFLQAAIDDAHIGLARLRLSG